MERQLTVDDDNVSAESVHPQLPHTNIEHEQHYEPQYIISVNSNAALSSSVCAVQKRAVQPSMDRFTQRPLPPNKKIKIDQQLITMIAKEYHPLNIVNDTEFKKFVELLISSYSLPTRKILSESLLPQRYLQLKEQVKKEISKALAVCITTDSWTSYNNEFYCHHCTLY